MLQQSLYDDDADDDLSMVYIEYMYGVVGVLFIMFSVWCGSDLSVVYRVKIWCGSDLSMVYRIKVWCHKSMDLGK